jgi:hypothetical protein
MRIVEAYWCVRSQVLVILYQGQSGTTECLEVPRFELMGEGGDE